MQKSTVINLNSIESEMLPFPHFSCTNVLNNGLEKELFDWFEKTDSWGLTEMDFYTQFEFSLLDVELPENLKPLSSISTINIIKERMVACFDAYNLEISGITAHKLINGHKIGLHNDFIGGEESHRMVLQINPGWNEDNGGFLMVFNSSDPEDLAKLVMPLNNTAFGFEISPRSYHAVSTVRNYSRYTLVYTFKTV